MSYIEKGHFGLEAVRDAAIHVIRTTEGPHFVYEKRAWGEMGDAGCVYIYEGNPDCLIARIVDYIWHREGFSDPSFVENSSCGNQPWTNAFTEEANVYMGELQRGQDGGNTWGVALFMAEAELQRSREVARDNVPVDV